MKYKKLGASILKPPSFFIWGTGCEAGVKTRMSNRLLSAEAIEEELHGVKK